MWPLAIFTGQLHSQGFLWRKYTGILPRQKKVTLIMKWPWGRVPLLGITKCLMRHILVNVISGLKLQICHHAFPLIFTVQAQFSKCRTEPPSYDFKIWTCWIFFRQELTTICLVAVIVPLPWLSRCLQVLYQEGIGNLLFTKLSPHLNFARSVYSYNFMTQWEELHKTMFVAKIHRSLSNIHKVMTLCANLTLVGSKGL